LMRNPVVEEELEPSKELILYEGAHPVGRYTLRVEDFGYVLVRGNRIVPVAAAARPVLDACDGQTSLVQLREHFGQEALDFVGLLVRKGLVELR
jgi:hypothetical protein